MAHGRGNGRQEAGEASSLPMGPSPSMGVQIQRQTPVTPALANTTPPPNSQPSMADAVSMGELGTPLSARTAASEEGTEPPPDYTKLGKQYRAKVEQLESAQSKLELAERRNMELRETLRDMEWESEALHVRAVDAETALVALQSQLKAMGAKPNLKRPDPSQAAQGPAEDALPAPHAGAAVLGQEGQPTEEEAGIVSSLFGWVTPECGGR